MVARDAHVLRIVLLCFMRTIDDLPLLAFLVELNLFIIANALTLIRALELFPD